MAEVKWIKLHTGMFDNAKIKYIRTLPEGNNIVLIWVMLLSKAGKCNSNGFIFLTENIPYTPQMLASEFDFDINTVELALGVFNKLDMIHVEEQRIMISDWQNHQNIEGLDKIREKTRKRVAKHREEKKQLPQGNVTCNVTVTDCNAIDIDKEEEKEENITTSQLKEVINLWNSLGINKIRAINKNSNRYTSLNARYKEFGMDEIVQAINNIKDSSFLKGKNNRNWLIEFDWLINANNFIKVLEGKYSDKKTNEPKGPSSNEVTPETLREIFGGDYGY